MSRRVYGNKPVMSQITHMQKVYDKIEKTTSGIRFLERQKMELIKEAREGCSLLYNCDNCPFLSDDNICTMFSI